MSVELHLPDLPEVPIALGPARGAAAPRVAVPWHVRLRNVLSAYLPLLLMALLALFTWWLVKNTPSAPAAREDAAPRREPDYPMTQFALERFEAGGRLKLRIEGAQMRHFPDTDRIEIEGVQIRAVAPDGRVTLASARRALSNGDGSEVQLMGEARVSSVDAAGMPIEMRSEFLHAFLVSERLRSHLPVEVNAGGNELRATGFEYDHGAQKLELVGPMQAVLPPRASRTPQKPQTPRQ
jgi:lipopolysaccharide export system protein LptC